MINLSRVYTRRKGRPEIRAVDPNIFRWRYFSSCENCKCDNGCCHRRVPVDIKTIAKLISIRADLEKFNIPAFREWFNEHLHFDNSLDTYISNINCNGGPQGNNSECVFLGVDGERGVCLIHECCKQLNVPSYTYKPLVCCLHPMTVCDGNLIPYFDNDVSGGDVTFYRRCRDALRFFYGNELIDELDVLERMQWDL